MSRKQQNDFEDLLESVEEEIDVGEDMEDPTEEEAEVNLEKGSWGRSAELLGALDDFDDSEDY